MWLVGMMGAGKSTIGPALARRLRRRFVDTDAEIERESGLAVGELFAREGEEAFRARERELVGRLLGQPAVVALGGGAIARDEVRAAVLGAGPVVYLRARPDTLLARLGDCGTRPLLAGLSPDRQLARLRELVAAREPAYASAAIAVDTDGVAVDEVVERIARGLAAREGAA